MANREGAHVELNEFATMNIAAPMNVIAGDPEDEAYRRAHVISFSGITYVQIFAFLTGFYLANRIPPTMATAGRHHPICVATSSRAHPCSIGIRPKPVRLHLPSSPCVNDIVHRFGEFGVSQ